MEYSQIDISLENEFNELNENYKSLNAFMKSLNGILYYYWDCNSDRFRYTIHEKDPRSNISTTAVCNYALCRYSGYWQENELDIIISSYNYILSRLIALTALMSKEDELIDEFTILNILPLIKKIEIFLPEYNINKSIIRNKIIFIIKKLIIEFIDNQLCKLDSKNDEKIQRIEFHSKMDTMPHPFIYLRLLEIIDLWGEEIYENILSNKEDWIQDNCSCSRSLIYLLGKMSVFREEISDKQKKDGLRVLKDYFFDIIYNKAKFQLHRQISLYESGDKTNFDVKKLIYSLLIVTKSNRYTNNLVKNKCLEIISKVQLDTGLLPIGHVVSNDFAIKDGEIAEKYISAKPIIATVECFSELLEHSDLYREMKNYPILFERVKSWIIENVRKDVENDAYLGWYPEYESRHSPQSWMVGRTLLFLINYNKYLMGLINFNNERVLSIEKHNDIEEGLNFDDLYDSFDFKKPLKYLMKNEEYRSALLFGPPGTGKSTIAKALARQLKWDYVEITPAEFLSAGDLQIIPNANKIFKRLNMLRDTVIFFDEVDLLLKSRMYEKEKKDNSEPEKNQDMSSREAWIVTSLLPKFQELHDNKDIIYILATNRANNVDPAFRRTGRIDVILPVGSISWLDRYKILYKKFFVFSWDKIPGKDETKLIEFLMSNFNIELGKKLEINKLDNDSIKISTDKDSILLKLDNQISEVSMLINGQESFKFASKTEKDRQNMNKLNIYSNYNGLRDEIFVNLSLDSSPDDILKSKSEKLYWFLLRTNYESILEINTILNILFNKLKSKQELEEHIVYKTFFLGEGNFEFDKYRFKFGQEIESGGYGFIRFSPDIQPPNNPDILKQFYEIIVNNTIYKNIQMNAYIKYKNTKNL